MSMSIRSETIKAMVGLAKELIEDNKDKINEAWLKAEDDKLKIGIAIDVSMNADVSDTFDIDETISFTLEKVKQKVSKRVSESQAELPLPLTGKGKAK